MTSSMRLPVSMRHVADDGEAAAVLGAAGRAEEALGGVEGARGPMPPESVRPVEGSARL